MPAPSLWQVLAEFPLFVVRSFIHPRGMVRSLDWDNPQTLQRLALYALLWLGLIVWAFSDNRVLAPAQRPLLSSFKGVVMRAHERSWDEPSGWTWLNLAPKYTGINMGKQEAKRLWDTLLTTRFLCFTMLAAVLAIGLVARLRMWRFGLAWEYALGTGLLGLLPALSCIALSLVPLGLLLLCRHCGVRLALFALLNIAGWAFLGYYTLADLGERPRGAALFFASLGWGFAQYLVAYAVFFALVCCVIPV